MKSWGKGWRGGGGGGVSAFNQILQTKNLLLNMQPTNDIRYKQDMSGLTVLL